MREYIIAVVICIFVADIAVMIMPLGNYKKYLKMIAGVIIMFVVVSPFIGSFKAEELFDFDEYFASTDDTYNIQNKDESIYEDYIRDIYERNSITSE